MHIVYQINHPDTPGVQGHQGLLDQNFFFSFFYLNTYLSLSGDIFSRTTLEIQEILYAKKLICQ